MISRDEVIDKSKQLYAAVEKFPKKELDFTDLSKLGVSYAALDLDSENPGTFCTPWPRKDFDLIYRQVPEGCKPEVPKAPKNTGPSFPYNKALACKNFLDSYFHLTTEEPEYLCEQRKWSCYEGVISKLTMIGSIERHNRWSMSTFFQVRQHEQHHIGTFLIDGRTPTEPLSRSELMVALHLINKGLARSNSAFDIPAILYSVAHTKARIIHASFEGTTLCVRTSQYIDICNGEEESFKCYLRWMLSDPKGAYTEMEKDHPEVWDARKKGEVWHPIVGWMNS